jgi:hypothetical protein
MAQAQLDCINFTLNKDLEILSISRSNLKVKCKLSNGYLLTIKPWKTSFLIILEKEGKQTRLPTDLFSGLCDLKETILFLTSLLPNKNDG